ncbi:MAG TPA: hypothetical protein PKO28_03975 [Bacilli bacterium]|nr:hypothetical protein [Bacilli bacterium]HPS18827.1 hypothetical protein [Bacilli bacterium]
MIRYPEFEHLKRIEDSHNPFSALYEYPDGSCFYIEPIFYTHLKGFKQHYPNEFSLILKEMEKVTKKNKKVIFTGDYDFPHTVASDFIFLEITDITNPLHLFVEDKSRGSDYGD